MDWIQVTVFTTAEGIEPVSGRLYRLGITGLEIEDRQEFEDFLRENRKSWDYVDEELSRKMSGETKVRAYLTRSAEGLELLSAIRGSMEELRRLDEIGQFGRLEIDLADMSEEDWANNWKQYFKPIAVGDRLLVCPEWETLPAEAEGRIVFTVNPGMTFGTGSHETTRLCLRALERAVTPGCSMLDLGCGSGILSIVSLELGAASAAAVDIDPNAVRIAYENAARNGVGRDRYTVLSGDLLTDETVRAAIGGRTYDVIAANIVADVIIALAPLVPTLLKKDGTFICSGILLERKDEVVEALAQQGITVNKVEKEKGWAALVCRFAQ